MSELPDLTPEEEQVRRLLADARHTLPVPDDVATRLDAVLADLRDEDPTALVPAAVTQQPADLAAARRRRHNVRSWLVAAAAVVVVGIGVNQVVQVDVSGVDAGSADSADSGGGDAPEAALGGGQSASKPQDEDGGPAEDAPDASSDQSDAGRYQSAPIRLDPDRFGTQVTRIRDRDRALLTTASANAATDGLLTEYHAFGDAYKATCPTTGWGRGRAVPVRYSGQPGVLVFRPVQGDTQVVDLFLCGSDHAERSITLPAP